jgi:hypothetical protein
MKSKKCFKCNNVKPLKDFYKHSEMNDGHLNKCISCTKNDVKVRILNCKNNPDWVIKEKKRNREKYYRLNYREKYQRKSNNKEYFKKFPEKRKAHSASFRIMVDSDNHRHHWSYNAEHYKDIIELNANIHYKIHRYMIYDSERMMYRRFDNMELLDSRKKHLAFINEIIANPKFD